MCKRVREYYQKLVPKELLDFIRGQLAGDYLRIFDDARNYDGDTQFSADRLRMDLKTYNRKAGELGKRCVDILVDLAVDGLKYQAEHK